MKITNKGQVKAIQWIKDPVKETISPGASFCPMNCPGVCFANCPNVVECFTLCEGLCMVQAVPK